MSGFINTPTSGDIDSLRRANAELQATVQDLKNRVERLETGIHLLVHVLRMDEVDDGRI